MKRWMAPVMLVAQVARAQQPVPAGEPPTPGVYNPTVGVAGEADASALEKNPASLGFLRSWSAVYLHSELDPGGVVGGRGDGFFLAGHASLLPVSLGLGLQLLRPPKIFPFPDETKFSVGLAARPAPGVALGFTYSYLTSNKGPIAGGLSTLDVALSLRLGAYLAAGLVVHDLPAPTVAGLPLQRVYEPELAFRPLGRDLLEVAAAVRIGERRGDVDPRFRLWVSPVRGIFVKAELELKRDVDLDGKLENDLRFAVGLEVNLERVGASGFGLFGRDQGSFSGHGFTVAARVSGERYGPVWRGPARLERIDLGGDLSARHLTQLLAHLRTLEHDSRTQGIVVVLGDPEGSWAVAEELRAAFFRLRRAGKHVFIYATAVNTRGYYIASAAERIFLDPAGGVQLVGLSRTVLFFKGTADLVGVRVEAVKIGEYKSAPEQFTRTGSSPPARAQREALLDDVYSHLVDGVAQGRRVDPRTVERWIDQGPYTAAQALTAQVVDELRSAEEVQDAIASQLGRQVALGLPESGERRPRSWQTPQIAVLFADGDLIDGKSQTIPLLNTRLIGAQTLIPAIERAQRDARIKAIVLRVDSPGGSALGSDRIARELSRAAAVKPVVCSMGDTAASGGYFIAAPCQRIFASPSTVTGSIGIFSMKFDVSGLAARLGVSVEHSQRGVHADLESMWRPYTEAERALVLEELRYSYGRFVNAVAKGRGLTAKEVDDRGRGHVYSGAAARSIRLVDELGGVMDAIDEAKRRAHLSERDEVELVALPEEPSLLAQLAGLLGISVSNPVTGASPALPATLAPLQPLLRDLARAIPASVLAEPATQQTRLDVELTIR